MKYTLQTVRYILKNFFYIFPFALFPAFLLSVSTDEGALTDVLTKLFEGGILQWSFYKLFCAISVLSFSGWKSIVFGIVFLPAVVVCVALMMALLDKHFRFGKRTFNGILSKLNDNFVSTCGYVFLIFAIYELWALIFSAFLFLASRILILPLAYIFVGIFFIVMHVLFLYLLGTTYLLLPCMQITGFRTFEALRYSYQLATPVKWKILLSQMVILFFAESLIGACAVFIPDFGLFTILTTFLYAVMLMIYCVRMEIAYFDRDSIKREDISEYYRR